MGNGRVALERGGQGRGDRGPYPGVLLTGVGRSVDTRGAYHRGLLPCFSQITRALHTSSQDTTRGLRPLPRVYGIGGFHHINLF